MNPIYRGQYPPINTDVLWIKGKQIFIYGPNGWEESSAQIDIDDSMIEDSENPVQSKVIQNSISNLEQSLEQRIQQKQNILSFDNSLSESSTNLIENSAVYKQYMTNIDTLEVLSIIDPAKEKEMLKKSYLTFKIVENGTQTNTVHWGGSGTIYYRKNGGEWTEGRTINCEVGDIIEFKGNGLTSDSSNRGFKNPGGSKFDVYGNVMSLKGGDNFENLTTLSSKFQSLFEETNVRDASKLILPCTSVNLDGGYRDMFRNSSITKAPELPATTVGYRAYTAMFLNCTSLIQAPPTLPAMLIETNGCSQMFSGCTSLESAPSIKAGLYYYQNQCSSMFYNCTSLKEYTIKSPEISSRYACTNMFGNCSSLQKIVLETSNVTIDTFTFGNWVQGVNANGTFYKKAAVTLPEGADGIPTGWTVETLT